MHALTIPYVYEATVLTPIDQPQRSYFRSDVTVQRPLISANEAPTVFDFTWQNFNFKWATGIEQGVTDLERCPIRKWNDQLWRTVCTYTSAQKVEHLEQWFDTPLKNTPFEPAISSFGKNDTFQPVSPSLSRTIEQYAALLPDGTQYTVENSNAQTIEDELKQATFLLVEEECGRISLLVPTEAPYYRLDVANGMIQINVAYNKANPDFTDRTYWPHDQHAEASQEAAFIAEEIGIDPGTLVIPNGEIRVRIPPPSSWVSPSRPAWLDCRL